MFKVKLRRQCVCKGKTQEAVSTQSEDSEKQFIRKVKTREEVCT